MDNFEFISEYKFLIEIKSSIEEKMKEMDYKGDEVEYFCSKARIEAFQEVIELINQKLNS